MHFPFPSVNGSPPLVLLIQPWVEDFYTTDCRIQPIGLAYLAGSLKQAFPDLDVRLYDALAGGHRRTIPWPRHFSYLRPYYGYPDQTPFSLFHQYFRFGKSEDEICRDLAELTPFLVGISSLFTPYYRQSLAMGGVCRQLFPGIPIVMGGSHATMHPATLLASRVEAPVCDFVLKGEAEQSICQLIEMLAGQKSKEDVHGLVTNDRASFVAAESSASPYRVKRETLRRLPWPRFDGLRSEDYSFDGRPMTFLVTSRSCPHRCSFCSIHAVFGNTYVTRDPDDVLAEINDRYDQGIRHFDIEDDNFTVNKKEITRLLDGLIAMNLPISLSAMNGLSYLALDKAILWKMKQAGFSALNLALVSSDKLVLEFTDRPHTVERFREVVGYARELGFKVTAYFILGMPGQTVTEMLGTLRTLAATQCLVGASPFYFTPGSPIHRQHEHNPHLRLASRANGGDPYMSARLTAMDLESDTFDREDVYTLFRLTRVVNYVKQGIDRGIESGDPYYDSVATLFREGRWCAESGKKRNPLPFSPKIADRLRAEPFAITGYRCGNALAWNPAQGQFTAVHRCGPEELANAAPFANSLSDRLSIG